MTTVAIVGCTHAGAHAAMTILDEHPEWTVDVFEQNDNVSFISGAIALWAGDHVSNPERMFWTSVEQLERRGAHMHMRHEVTQIDIRARTLDATDLDTAVSRRYKFDKIVITTGSKPAVPSIQGIENGLKSDHIMLCKSYEEGKRIAERAKNVKSVVVMGAGYIGAELAEQFSMRGIETTLIDALPHVLDNNYDRKVTDQAEDAFEEHGVTLALGQKVVAFRPAKGRDGKKHSAITTVTELGEYTADLVVMGVGLIPNTSLVSKQLKTLGYGAIIVDKYMRASSPDDDILDYVFAAGDSATVHFNPTNSDEYRPLATNALRQSTLVGKNIDVPTTPYTGTQSTSAVQLYDLCLASSGITLDLAKRRHIDVASTTICVDYRPDFMPTTTPVTATLIWNKATRKVLGAQFAAKHDISMAANVVSVAIQADFTIDQLADVDMLFQPNFSQPINYINTLAQTAVKETDRG